MHMAQIGAEGDKVPGDGLCVVRALFQGADRERMPDIVNAWSALAGFAPQPNRPGQLQKDGNHRGVRRCSAADRDKQGAIERSNPRPNGKVPIQGPLRRVMQRDELTFLNLVCRIIRPSGVTSLSCSAKASEMRRPVAARRPNSVAYVRGLIEPGGPKRAAACTSEEISSGV